MLLDPTAPEMFENVSVPTVTSEGPTVPVSPRAPVTPVEPGAPAEPGAPLLPF